MISYNHTVSNDMAMDESAAWSLSLSMVFMMASHFTSYFSLEIYSFYLSL